jgi:hypothetical protein
MNKTAILLAVALLATAGIAAAPTAAAENVVQCVRGSDPLPGGGHWAAHCAVDCVVTGTPWDCKHDD